MLAKPLVACTYLSSIVSELFEPQVQKIPVLAYRSSHFCQITLTSCFPRASITQYVAWMERLFDAYKLSRSMYLSIFNTFWVIRWLSKCVSPKIAIFTTFLFPPPWGDALVVITSMWYGWKENWNRRTPGWPPPYVYTCRARRVSDSYAYGRRMWHENIV